MMERLVISTLNQQELQDHFMEVFNRECRISLHNGYKGNSKGFKKEFYDRAWADGGRRLNEARLRGTVVTISFAVFEPKTDDVMALFFLMYGDTLVIEV